MLQISLKIRIINKRNQFFLLIGTLTIGEKLTLKIKKGKLQDVPFVTQKCIGEKHAFLNMPSCPHVVDVAKSFSEFQDEKVWDEKVNIILITNSWPFSYITVVYHTRVYSFWLATCKIAAFL